MTGEINVARGGRQIVRTADFGDVLENYRPRE
jgi:hypothetical protein